MYYILKYGKQYVSVTLPVVCLITFSIPYIVHYAGRGRMLEGTIIMKSLFSLYSEVHVNGFSSGCNVCKLKVQ